MVIDASVIDLSLPITSLATPMFPGYPQPLMTTFATVRENGYQSHVWTIVEHTATHVDAPLHMVDGGDPIDKMSLERFVRPGIVLDFSKAGPRHRITRDEITGSLDRSTAKGRAVLFRTGYRSPRPPTSSSKHLDLTREAAEALIGLGVALIGVDAPSPDHAPYSAHKVLLPAGIPIFENLTNLEKITGSEFTFVGAPLLLVGGSGSPCRAFALTFSRRMGRRGEGKKESLRMN